MDFSSGSYDATLLNISLKGALIEFNEDVILQKGDKFKMTFLLGDSDVSLQFESEVVHLRKHLAGVRFANIRFRYNDRVK